MQFGVAYSSALKADLGNAFKFTSPPETILLAESHDAPDSSPYGDGFNFLDLSDYIKVHKELCRFY